LLAGGGGQRTDRPTIPPFEFENWAVIALGGIPNKVQVGDMGVDGRIFPVFENSPACLTACRVMARRLRDVCNCRSAPVPGRSNVAGQTVIGLNGARSSQDIAAAGDGRTPPSISPYETR